MTMQSGVYISDGISLDYDVCYPMEQTLAMPALVLVFGGRWMRGTRARFYPQAEYFALLGYAVFTPDYRVFERQGTTPREAVRDIAAFWMYLRHHAADLRIDPERVALGGGSAGAHTVIMAGLTTNVLPKAYVLYNPVVCTDSPLFHEKLLAPALKGGNYRDIDPMSCLGDRFPPVIFLHGKEDDQVPAAEMQRFAERVRALGGSVELCLYDHAGHGFFNKDRSEEFFEATNREIAAFLHKYL